MISTDGEGKVFFLVSSIDSCALALSSIFIHSITCLSLGLFKPDGKLHSQENNIPNIISHMKINLGKSYEREIAFSRSFYETIGTCTWLFHKILFIVFSHQWAYICNCIERTSYLSNAYLYVYKYLHFVG